jgi:UDP-2,3-diacylglucosamine hydrolase
LRALFISDLHLSEDRPEANERFFEFLETEADGADALYVLGDLFEYWIGDDDVDEPFNAIVSGFFRRITQSGTQLRVMHGNRDFLLGERFCQVTGAELLADPTELDIGGEKTLLMHGDTLCTDDLEYQNWRRTSRSSAWQKEFLGKSLDERRSAVHGLREKSKEVIQAKPPEIMDVNADAVVEALRRSGAKRLIHGHTHRAAHHKVKVDGRDCERWVLPDWYGRGGYLEIAGNRPKLVRW